MKPFTGLMDGLGWEGLQTSSSSTTCRGQRHLPLSQVALSPVQPGLEHFQAFSCLIENFIFSFIILAPALWGVSDGSTLFGLGRRGHTDSGIFKINDGWSFVQHLHAVHGSSLLGSEFSMKTQMTSVAWIEVKEMSLVGKSSN